MVIFSAYKATTSIRHIWPTFSATETTPTIITLSLLLFALIPTIFSIIDEIIMIYHPWSCAKIINTFTYFLLLNSYINDNCYIGFPYSPAVQTSLARPRNPPSLQMNPGKQSRSLSQSPSPSPHCP